MFNTINSAMPELVNKADIILLTLYEMQNTRQVFHLQFLLVHPSLPLPPQLAAAMQLAAMQSEACFMLSSIDINPVQLCSVRAGPSLSC